MLASRVCQRTALRLLHQPRQFSAFHPLASISFSGFRTMASQEASPAPQNGRNHQPHHKQDSRPSSKNKRPAEDSKRPSAQPKSNRSLKRAKKRERAAKGGSADDVLLIDIEALLSKLSVEEGRDSETANESLPEQGTEIEVEVVELSSTGEALALYPGSNQIYVLSFAVPGDKVKVKVWRHFPESRYTAVDLISVTKPSPVRDDSRITCKYFGKCAGCQFQMLDYAEQLRIKRTVVEKAFRNFSQLPPELIPTVQDTIGSPLQYGYRTKLTPHFDGASNFRKGGKLQEVPAIGFTEKGRRTTLDIEECPIGTEAVLKGLVRERARMKKEYGNYSKGATILLRESTQRFPKDGPEQPPAETPTDAVRVESDEFTEIKSCITDNNATTTEYIDSYVFTNPAGSFFQNNNSILPVFTSYIRDHILPPSTAGAKPIKYLIDAYSGSGLFTITLSSLFHGTGGRSTGIDISPQSIQFAAANARLNSIPDTQCQFIAADAGELFKSVTTYDRDETVVVLDPPRKGCDDDFLAQLLDFAPKRVVYVSCNVHTQARDVGILVRGEVAGKGKLKSRYEMESLRGFDFFPQTGHVEGVAVLNRVDESPEVETST